MRKWLAGLLLFGLLLIGGTAIAQYPTIRRMPTIQQVDAPGERAPSLWIQIGLSAITILGCWFASAKASSREAGKLEGKVLTMLTSHHEDIKALWAGKVDHKLHEGCRHAFERELESLKPKP